MLGNQYGIDLGKIYAEGENIKNAKLKNSLLKQEVNNYKLQNQPVTHSVFLNHNKQKLLDISHNLEVQRLKQANPNLSDDEINALASKETNEFGKTLDEFYKAPKYTQAQYAQMVDQYGRQLYYIANLPPDQQEGAYQMWRSQLPQSELEGVPEHYDPTWANIEMIRSSGALKLYDENNKYLSQAKLAQQKLKNALTLEAVKGNIQNKNTKTRFNLLKNLNDYKTRNLIKVNALKNKGVTKSTQVRDTGYKQKVSLEYSKAIDSLLENYTYNDETKRQIASMAERYVKQGQSLNTAVKNAIKDYISSRKWKKDGKIYTVKDGKLTPYKGD